MFFFNLRAKEQRRLIQSNRVSNLEKRKEEKLKFIELRINHVKMGSLLLSILIEPAKGEKLAGGSLTLSLWLVNEIK